MPLTYAPVVTDVGRAAALAQDLLGLSLSLTHVKVGSSSYNPTAAQTALVAPLHKGTLVGNATAGDTVSGVMRVPADTYLGAAFAVGEIGFYAGDPDTTGILFAVLSKPGDLYGNLGGGQVADITAQITLRLSSVPSGSVTIALDTQALTAAALMMEHIASTSPHPNSDGVPVGVVLPYYGVNPPKGYVMPYGWLLSRATYPELWAHAQSQNLVVTDLQWAAGGWGQFSSGDGTTTFRTPDLRGEFMRFGDVGRGVDIGRTLGSFQDWSTGRPKTTEAVGVSESGATQALRTNGQTTLTGVNANPSQSGFVRVAKTGNRNTASTVDTIGAGTEMDVINVVIGDPETRPRNVALGCIMKAAGSANAVLTAPPPAAPTPVNPPAPTPTPAPSGVPVVDFTATPRDTGGGWGWLFVTFTDLSVGGTSWLWQFGDGATSTLQHPTHQFVNTNGNGTGLQTFTVALTVTNASGSTTVTRAAYISVDAAPSGA
jgi:PKD repeat protein